MELSAANRALTSAEIARHQAMRKTLKPIKNFYYLVRDSEEQMLYECSSNNAEQLIADAKEDHPGCGWRWKVIASAPLGVVWESGPPLTPPRGRSFGDVRPRHGFY